MVYHISRGGQNYGPYTLADLQRYVASGHVLLTDLAKSDEMPEWVPVSQVVNPGVVPPVEPPAPEYGAPPAAYVQPGYVQPGYAAPPGYPPTAVVPSVYADPPNLHWGLVLLFGVLTCGIFIVVWELVQSAWLKKVAPQSKALTLYIVADVAYLGVFYSSFMTGFNHTHSASSGIFQLVYVVLNVWARFSFKASLEEHFNTVEPIGLVMSGVMTFFFGSLYLQWHLTRINEIRRGLRYR